jgi:hypothetical protein
MDYRDRLAQKATREKLLNIERRLNFISVRGPSSVPGQPGLTHKS